MYIIYMKQLWGCTLINLKGKKFHAGAWSGDTMMEAALACKNGSSGVEFVKIIVRGNGDNSGQTMTYVSGDL